MPKWLSYTILSIVLWGLWGVVAKQADAEKVGPKALQAISTIGVVPASLLLIASPGFRRNKNIVPGCVFAFATGLCASVGNLALFISLDQGAAASVVTPLTGMFPLVTLILALIILRERFNWIQGAGMLISLGAIYLFSLPDDARTLDHIPLKTLLSDWMAWALAAMVLWGVAAILQKLATKYISSELSTVMFALGFIPVAVFLVLKFKLDWNISTKGWALAIFLGALIGVGGLTLFAAYRDGKASIVTALYALYPALTVGLAVPLFHEPWYLRKAVAIALALIAALALSYERPATTAAPSEFEISPLPLASTDNDKVNA